MESPSTSVSRLACVRESQVQWPRGSRVPEPSRPHIHAHACTHTPRPPPLQWVPASVSSQRARAGGVASVLLSLRVPPPRGARTTRPQGPPPLPLPARLFVSNIRVSPLARLRGRSSGAILDSVQLPSPSPSPTPPPLFMAPPDSAPAPRARAQPRCAMPESGAPRPVAHHRRRRPPVLASSRSPDRSLRRPQRP